ncbi:UNVERIFIED_ORG: hypothetical protein ABID33_000286 [Xanthobacter viscosus]|uniref:Uncharacterized protein n=1 Tax=Xanthobacter autotrophicus TaxID=280 RepID=A0A6C1KJL6_XANAU|nr:hypothetical protein [Xanthobacter autotrophicus]TLX43827.1 hypothetical protein FBQ73_06925 [Xanthobacter autotrophicus]
MRTMKLPLSGDVVQAIWTAFLSPFNNQIGVININLGKSSAPEVEEQVLNEVGSYGRQLGRIGDALTVLMKHFHPAEPLAEHEQEALIGLKLMLDEIADIKEQYKREAIRA